MAFITKENFDKQESLKKIIEEIKNLQRSLYEHNNDTSLKSREFSICITKIEETEMWLHKLLKEFSKGDVLTINTPNGLIFRSLNKATTVGALLQDLRIEEDLGNDSLELVQDGKTLPESTHFHTLPNLDFELVATGIGV